MVSCMLCEFHPNISKRYTMFQEKQNKTIAYFKKVKTLAKYGLCQKKPICVSTFMVELCFPERCLSPSPQYLWMWPYLEVRSSWMIKLRPLGGPNGVWCAYKTGNVDPERDVHKGKTMWRHGKNTSTSLGHLRSREAGREAWSTLSPTAFRRSQPCRHCELGLWPPDCETTLFCG